MPAKFLESPEAQEIAERLISQYHEHLLEAKIAYAKRYGTWTSKGQTVLGRAVKVSERDKLFHGYDFLVIVNADEWLRLTPEQRVALVDHELCHCQRAVNADGDYVETKDGKPVWTIAGHPVEEFPEIVDRHGAWDANLKLLAKKLKRITVEAQATLDDYDESGQIAAGSAVPVDAAEPGESMVAEGSEADEDEVAAGPLYRRYYCLKCRKRVEAREVVTFEQGKPIHRRDDGTECDDPVFVALPGEPDPDLEALAGAMDHARAAS
ncbi:MAG: putative metallopeptidase [Bacillota bacterium]